MLFPLGSKKRRTLQNFYLLWFILNDINLEMIRRYRNEIKSDLKEIFHYMKYIPTHVSNNSMELFNKKVENFWSKYRQHERTIVLSEDEKKNLIKSQKNICPLCNSSLFYGEEIETHHVNPIAIGGRDSFLNLRITHKDCNRQAGSRSKQ